MAVKKSDSNIAYIICMKKIILTYCLLTFVLFCRSQTINNFLPASEFSKNLEKIVLDFRNDYHTISVDTSVSHQAEYDSYNTSVMLPDAITCTIMRFHSENDTSSAYQACFYNGSNYAQALRVYKSCIRQIRGSKIHWIDRRLINFKGNNTEVDPNVRFATCELRLNLDDPRYERFCAEISLQNTTLDTWQVQVNFFSKPLDNDESRG